MIVEWPPIPLYIAFAVVATWSSILGAELRKENVDSVEERGLSRLRKLLQWSGVASAVHLLGYLSLAYWSALSTGDLLGALSVVLHMFIVLAVMMFMTMMFSISFKRTRQTT